MSFKKLGKQIKLGHDFYFINKYRKYNGISRIWNIVLIWVKTKFATTVTNRQGL